MLSTVSAAIVLAVCLVLMARLLVGARPRAKFDAWARGVWWSLKRSASGLKNRRNSTTSRKSAEKLAEEAIRRARGEDDGHWEGNVYKPKSFKRPPRDKMH